MAAPGAFFSWNQALWLWTVQRHHSQRPPACPHGRRHPESPQQTGRRLTAPQACPHPRGHRPQRPGHWELCLAPADPEPELGGPRGPEWPPQTGSSWSRWWEGPPSQVGWLPRFPHSLPATTAHSHNPCHTAATAVGPSRHSPPSFLPGQSPAPIPVWLRPSREPGPPLSRHPEFPP